MLVSNSRLANRFSSSTALCVDDSNARRSDLGLWHIVKSDQGLESSLVDRGGSARASLGEELGDSVTWHDDVHKGPVNKGLDSLVVFLETGTHDFVGAVEGIRPMASTGNTSIDVPPCDSIVAVIGILLGLGPACWLVLDNSSINDVLGNSSNPSVVKLESI